MITQSSVANFLEQQRAFFKTGKTKDLAFRIEQLKRLKQAISENEEAIAQALKADLGKPKFEVVGAEFSLCLENINYTLKHLKSWLKPKGAYSPISTFPAKAQVIPEPLGVVLIIAPWNYPWQLLITPWIGAIAAGNCAILKPSEISAHNSSLLANIFSKYFDPRVVAVVEGDKDITQELLTQKFDHIFFTGGTNVGKIVMQAAAKNLTPVTLELGGKSPCIVDSNVNLEIAARRITWGKFLNAGQICVAPDYLLVHSSIKQQLIKAMVECIQEFYGIDPEKSPDYSRIISERHFQRLVSLLKEGKITIGGETNANERYIAPTVIEGINWDSEVMQDEIFGPILPVLEYENLDHAIAKINSRPKPLALYLFSREKHIQEKVLRDTSSGGVAINDTIMQLSSPELPFGGVGNSGMGCYHGKFSFDTFSHYKSVLKKSFWFDIKLRYPPYAKKLKLIKLLFR